MFDWSARQNSLRKQFLANFVCGPYNFGTKTTYFVFFSDTHCLDTLFETKCFINLSCGYRNLTKSINYTNQLRLLKKHYILTEIYVNFSCFYENFKLPLAWETT